LVITVSFIYIASLLYLVGFLLSVLANRFYFKVSLDDYLTRRAQTYVSCALVVSPFAFLFTPTDFGADLRYDNLHSIFVCMIFLMAGQMVPLTAYYYRNIKFVWNSKLFIYDKSKAFQQFTNNEARQILENKKPPNLE